ncbi:MAG TPA: hypothetical protein VGL81_30525 [Polyangiaceae bacterium]|jgi:hypothetical protein
MGSTSSSVLQRIADDAWRETARLALAALSHRPGELGEAGRALARTLDLSAPMPEGVTGLAQSFADRAPEAVRAALLEALDWELHTYRGGRKVEATHRLEAIVEPLPPASSEPSRAAAEPRPGFGDDVLAMDLAAPHSMGDLTRYANAYLGSTFVNDAIENDRPVELHNGTAPEAMAAMRARGASSFHQLATPKLHFQILLGDDLRYAIACDDGRDMFRHLEKVLRAARSTNGRHVDPARVTRFDHRVDEESYRPARFRRCFESSGTIPPQVTVGFKNALLGALAVRARRAAQVLALQASPSLPRELEPLRDLDARELLRSASRRAWLAELEARAKAAGHGELLTAAPAVKLAVTDGPDAFLDHSRLAYRDAFGERREILLVRNPYGEAAVAMGALFRDCGVEDVLVYGTAASLDRASQVGELHLASHATSADGAVHEFQNHALDERFAALHAEPGTRLGSRVVNVRSPLDEFDHEIDRLRAEGHHLVEMELAGLLRGLRGGRARIAALHVVSDVPQSADTLEGFSPTRAERALGAAVDVWVETFGIAELECR